MNNEAFEYLFRTRYFARVSHREIPRHAAISRSPKGRLSLRNRRIYLESRRALNRCAFERITGLDMDATSERIGSLIRESGMNDRQLGEIMGLSVQAINKWRHGRCLPDIENMLILGAVLGRKVDDFLVPIVA